jgi:hypothetical protein
MTTTNEWNDAMKTTSQTTTYLRRGTKLLNTGDGEVGTVLRARLGRSGTLRGYDVRTADGIEAWGNGEFIRLYEVEFHGRKTLVTIPEN